MSERLAPPTRRRGFTAQMLRYWGLFFLAVGIAGQTILQHRILGVGSMELDQLSEALKSDNNMIIATVAIIAQLVETCAIPLFCFLLVQGVTHTASFKKYLLRVLGIAALSEIPYNLAYSDKWLDFSSRNPVFGLVLALVMIFLYKQYAAKSFKGIAICILVAAMGFLWAGMLQIDNGAVVAVLVSVLWFTRKKRWVQIFTGCAVMFICTAMSPMYFSAPMLFLMVHFYNDEPGEGNRWVNYLAYPVLLLVIWLVGILIF